MKPYHRHVSPNAGKSPVAQAVAKARLAESLLDLKIALYMLTPGAPCADLLGGICKVMQVVQTAALAEGIENVATRILKGGLNACVQQLLLDAYDPTQTVAISTGLDQALLLARQVKPSSINAAWSEQS
jgi:hypothetical protein